MKNLLLTASSQFLAIFAAISLLLVPNSSAIDLVWEGENYRDVNVVKVEGDNVTLESRKKEKIVVPLGRLSGLLAADAKKMAEAQATAKPEKKVVRAFSRGSEVRVQDTWERAWIFGITSSPTADGFDVTSGPNGLPRGRERNGEPGKVQTTKSGQQVYPGRVFVRGMTSKENLQFNRILWRDGYITRGRLRIPAFAASRPHVKLPVMAGERDWTNTDGRKMRATLKSVEGSTGHFLNSGGKPFTYELTKLMADDQVFAKQADEKYRKEVEQIKKDYPWLKFK